MKMGLSLCLWLLGACIPFSVSAQQRLPELLMPVDQSISDKFATPSNFDLRDVLYFSKRHRIVHINFDLLKKPNATFTITAFDDRKVTVQARELASKASYGESVEWKGVLLDPRLVVAATEDGSDPKFYEDQLNSVSLWFVNEARDVPPGLRKEFPGPSTRQHPPGSSAVMKIKIPTLLGQWSLPTLESTIHVMPVPEDPRYHVVYEEDAAKVPEGKDFEERRRRYGEFRRTLERQRKESAADSQPTTDDL